MLNLFVLTQRSSFSTLPVLIYLKYFLCQTPEFAHPVALPQSLMRMKIAQTVPVVLWNHNQPMNQRHPNQPMNQRHPTIAWTHRQQVTIKPLFNGSSKKRHRVVSLFLSKPIARSFGPTNQQQERQRRTPIRKPFDKIPHRFANDRPQQSRPKSPKNHP